jgi:hypothetical protein
METAPSISGGPGRRGRARDHRPAHRSREALANIAGTTLANITAVETGRGTLHRVTAEEVKGGSS